MLAFVYYLKKNDSQDIIFYRSASLVDENEKKMEGANKNDNSSNFETPL
jgi:hypothetical protein